MPLNIGDIAPLITGTDVVSNQPWALADQANKTVLLAFAGITWCGPCMAEAPALEAVWQELRGCTYPPLSMAIISGKFSEEEDPQKIQNAIANYGITFPVVPGTGYWPAYKIISVPTLYCLGWDEESDRHKVCAIKVGASGTTLEIKQSILDFLFGCGLSRIARKPSTYWAAVYLLLFGGVGTGGGGVGITPGGEMIPIPPRDPLRYLGPAGRDALTGLAVAELSGQINDPDQRSRVLRDGLRTAQVAIQRLEELSTVDPARVTRGGAAWGRETVASQQKKMKQNKKPKKKA
jgi:thiol-disulfide isomerase/thioredoxin